MTTLHLGVIELPYSHAADQGKSKSGKSKASTTGDVAEILENKYHVMEHFFELHFDEIVKALEGSITGSLESLLMGGPPTLDPNGTGTNEIMKLFQTFLESKEMDGLGYPGVPTAASIKGVSHRFKNRRGTPGRPSFVDTGLFESAFRAWVD